MLDGFKEVGLAADIWSFGILMTELLFPFKKSAWEGCLDKKRRPVEGTNGFSAFVDDGGLPILKLKGDEGQHVKDYLSLIQKCLVHEEGDRWNIAQVNQALMDIIKKL
jgi:hypothetical protein